MRRSLLLICLIASACAPTVRWEHAERPPSQWSTDMSTCRRWAAQQVEKDVARSDYGGAGVTSAGTYASQMAAYDSSKRRTELLERCLRSNGYQPVEK
ncbi:hypothetical protein JCM17960_04730 [Magnetospira thiophila]